VQSPSGSGFGTIITQIFVDTNNDNVMDVNDTPVSGASVTIINRSETMVSQTTTDTSGKTVIENLTVGTYTVIVVVTGYTTQTTTVEVTSNVITYVNVPVPGAPSGQGYPSPSSAGQPATAPSPSGSSVQGMPSNGSVPTGTIIGTAFIDTNGNGVQDNSETFLSDVTVTIVNSSTNTKIATTKTDTNGYWTVTNIIITTYNVVYNTPKGYTPTTVSTGIIEGITPAETVTAGGPGWAPCGFKPVSGTGTILVTVCSGSSNSQSCSGSFTPTSDIPISVYPEGSNVPLDTKPTGPDGTVTFDVPAPGTYTVGLPDSLPYNGPEFDQGVSKPLEVTPGSYNTLDAPLPDGAIQGNVNVNTPMTGSIVGVVWLDNDRDGQKGTLDTGMPDVTVHLGTTDSKTVLQTTTTNTVGYYSFSVNITTTTYTYTVVVDNPNPDYFAFVNATCPENTVNNYGAGEVDVGPGAVEGTVNAGMQAKPGVKESVCTSNDKLDPTNPCHFVPSSGLF